MGAAAKRQPELEGFERPTIPEVEEAALALARVRYERMRLQVEEGQLATQLLQRMEAHADDLETDDEDRPIYVVVDGEHRIKATLKSTRKVALTRDKVAGDEG